MEIHKKYNTDPDYANKIRENLCFCVPISAKSNHSFAQKTSSVSLIENHNFNSLNLVEMFDNL